jgi:hypothetical protein
MEAKIMKHLIIGGAAGLLLSTTALAAVGAANKDMAATASQSSAPVSKSAPSLDAAPIGNAILIDHPAKSAVEPVAATDSKTFTAGDSKAPAEPAAAETPSTAAMTDAAKDMQGVGGPDEAEADSTAPVAAATQTSYRACSPGPGDDNCIQLYEPGVSASYAAWQAGNAPGAVQTGMGGPEEDESAAAVEPATDEFKDMATVQPAAESEDLTTAEPAAAESEDLAAYDEPLPEDLVLPASEEMAGNQPSRQSDSTTAL